MPAQPYSFIGGPVGPWKIASNQAIAGPAIPTPGRLDIVPGMAEDMQGEALWIYRGMVSHLRYTHGDEKDALAKAQPELNRGEATFAAMILIKKSEAWWSLAQDARRGIMEEQSEHIKTGMKYLPAIARRLHHSRDLNEPFDFITWFEFAPDHVGAFNRLLLELRETREWDYVEREIDIRVLKG